MMGVLCCVATVVGGCRTQRDRADRLNPRDVLEGDYPLEPWENPGRRLANVSFADILFAFDSSRLAQADRPKAAAVARYLGRNRNIRVVLEGHCDERGSREYNILLGERRALSVRRHMIALGVQPSRVLTRSFGEEALEVPGHNESSWRLNRRVAFALYR